MYNYNPFYGVVAMTGYFFYVLLIADIILKGFSLWKSARNGQTVWFVALLLINSVGILPIIYLLLENNKKVQTMAVSPARKIIKKKAVKK